MHKDGLYVSHGPDKHTLVIIREDNGRTLWVRDFVTIESALDILEDDVLCGHNRANILSNVTGNRGFFTDDFNEPEGGFSACSFIRYLAS